MSWLRRRMMANVGGADPYAGFTFGYGIDVDGNLYENPNLCVSDYIPMPVSLTSTYLMTEFAGPYVYGNSNVGNMTMCFYDENKNLVAYTRYNIINKTSENKAPYAYVRFCCYAPDIDTAFLRVTNDDASHSYYDLFAGAQVPDSYRNVLYGYLQTTSGLAKNLSNVGNGSSCCIGYYSPITIPASTQSVEMNIGPDIIIPSGTFLGRLLLLDSGYAVIDYYSQSAAPRVMTDDRFGTTWPFVQKNSFSKLIDTTYLLDVTNNNYLFRGLDVQ